MDDLILRRALEAVAAKKAVDPVILDISALTPFADCFLICSGQTSVQIGAVADSLQEEMDNAGLVLRHREGGSSAPWILLDYGGLVAHIMLQEQRDFYQLERLWHDAVRLDPLAEE